MTPKYYAKYDNLHLSEYVKVPNDYHFTYFFGDTKEYLKGFHKAMMLDIEAGDTTYPRLKEFEATHKRETVYTGPLRCTRPTAERRYIETLSRCTTPTRSPVIYGCKHPYLMELHMLICLGYVERYTVRRYLKQATNAYGQHIEWAKVYWYKATPKGMRLLKKVNRH